MLSFLCYVLLLPSTDGVVGPGFHSLLGHLQGGLQVLHLIEVVNDGLDQAEGSLGGVVDDTLRLDIVLQLGVAKVVVPLGHRKGEPLQIASLLPAACWPRN